MQRLTTGQSYVIAGVEIAKAECIMSEKRNDTPTIALIGTGMWGRNIARNLANLGALAGICDTAPERAKQVADEHGVAAMGLDDILGNPAIAGVAVATPSSSHYDLAIAALAAGKHIYVEKPLALTLADAEAIAQAAATAKRQVMLGHLLRYHDAFITLAQAVAEGQIGKLRHIRASRLAPGRVRANESALYDLCPHDLAMIYHLVNGAEAEQVSCHMISHITPGVDDIVTAQIGFANGVSATIQANWMNPVKVHNLTVVGDEASLVFDDTKLWKNKLTRYPMRIKRDALNPDLERGEAEAMPLPDSEPLKDEMQAFINMVKTNQPPRTDITEALYVQRLLNQMQMNADQKLSAIDKTDATG